MTVCYEVAGQNGEEAAREYARRHPPPARLPTARTIMDAVRRMREEGNLRPNLHLERVRPVREILIPQIRQRIRQNGTASTRELARAVNGHQSTVHQILKKDLRMHPFHYRKVQHLRKFLISRGYNYSNEQRV